MMYLILWLLIGILGAIQYGRALLNIDDSLTYGDLLMCFLASLSGVCIWSALLVIWIDNKDGVVYRRKNEN